MRACLVDEPPADSAREEIYEQHDDDGGAYEGRDL